MELMETIKTWGSGLGRADRCATTCLNVLMFDEMMKQ